MPNPAPVTHAGDQVHAARARNGRLEFLDSLRGIAALVVAVQHLGEVIWPGMLAWSHHWWRPGEFGVLVFFICSGFIIPASMERRGDLVEFWIGRVFRLFPLYLSVLIVALIAFATPLAAPDPNYHPVVDSAINLTMLQVFSSRPLVIGASWTLGYEMVFYLLLTVLFMLGWHRRSAGIATGLVISRPDPGRPSCRPYPCSGRTADGGAPAIGRARGRRRRRRRCPRLAGRQRWIGLTLALAVLMLVAQPAARPVVSLLLLGVDVRRDRRSSYDVGQLAGGTDGPRSSAFAMVGIVVVERFYHVGSARARSPARYRGGGPRPARSLLGLSPVRRPVPAAAQGLPARAGLPRHHQLLGLPGARARAAPPAARSWPPFVLYAVLLTATIGLASITYRLIEKPGQLRRTRQ